MKRKLSQYKEFISEKKISEIHRKGTKLSRHHILHVSPSYYGGGIAETLRRMVPLLNAIGVEVGWRAMVGSPDFFRVCKKFHNALLGDEIDLTEMVKKVYEEASEDFAKFTHLNHDIVIVHNHHPLPLVKFYRKRQPWLWRCHEDMSDPDQGSLEYLKSFLIPFDRCIFQTGQCAPVEFQEGCSYIHPSIDPLSIKNEDIGLEKVKKYLGKVGVDTTRPIVSQVSQFDKHKDPMGVLKVFENIRSEMDCQLILIGSINRYDPEGEEIYDRVLRKAAEMEDVYVVLDPHDIVINSVQRASQVVLQKSLKEGFGLSVSEALWKETPVVGSDRGGIGLQIKDGENGYLVEPEDYEAVAKRVMKLLSDRDLRDEMGRKGKEFVSEKFLITRQIEDWLDLWSEMLTENS